ncbi:MAG: alpha/beta hydrolase, partial [Myxococcales bacterium]
MTSPTSHHLTLRGLPLRVLDWAPLPGVDPARWPVLLLHGFADTAPSWAPVAHALQVAGHRVIAPDQRGFGDSGRAGAGGYYHFPDYVADVDALVRALDLPTLALVGHSMGGTVATLFAGSRPGQVGRLALLEGLGPPDSEPAHAPARFTRWLDDLAREGGRGRERSFDADSALSR